MADERIIAVGLLTKNDVRLLGPTFDRLWPIEDASCFSELLEAIDQADAEFSDASENSAIRPTDA